MRILVISSCTKVKNGESCPAPLREADFDDPRRLRKREASLAKWLLPATQLYAGMQHTYAMTGVSHLRRFHGADSCAIKIISAGYGLVDEQQLLAPYDTTFQGKTPRQIQTRAEQLRVGKAVREAIAGCPLVVFLLGEKYLHSISLPLEALAGQRFIFFSSNTKLPLSRKRTTIVSAGKPETAHFHAGTAALKGRMFQLLAYGLSEQPSMFEPLLRDDSAASASQLMESGLSHL